MRLRRNDVKIFIEPRLRGIDIILSGDLHHVQLHCSLNAGDLNINLTLLLRQEIQLVLVRAHQVLLCVRKGNVDLAPAARSSVNSLGVPAPTCNSSMLIFPP